MKILSRYVLRQFLAVFALALAAFVGLYLVIDFFEKVDDLLQKQVALTTALRYFFHKTPLIVAQGIPMAVLLATLISLGILKRNRELIAMKTAGVHPSVYATPLAVAAFFIALVHFAAGETIARSMSQKAQDIWQQEIQHKKSSFSWTREDIWYHGRDCIYQARLYDSAGKTLQKVSLYYLDKDFKLIRRIDSKRMRWNDGRWTAEEGLVLRLDGIDTQQERFQEKDLEVPETPKDFASLQTIPEQLNWVDLYHYSRKVRQEGYNAAPYTVELHLRIAFPMTTFVLALLGISLSLRQAFHTGIAAGVTVALVIAFLYLTLLHVGCSMATAGLLPPIIGAWAANVIFAALAYHLWLSNQQ